MEPVQAVPDADVGDTPSGSGASASSGAGTVSASRVSRSLPAFSTSCRAVVTFALCRSGACGNLPEKRLFEVEALEHNTLQEVMGEFRLYRSGRVAPCLHPAQTMGRRQGGGAARVLGVMRLPDGGEGGEKGGREGGCG